MNLGGMGEQDANDKMVDLLHRAAISVMVKCSLAHGDAVCLMPISVCLSGNV